MVVQVIYSGEPWCNKTGARASEGKLLWELTLEISISLSPSPSLSHSLSDSLSVSLSVSLYISLSLSLSVSLSVSLSLCLSVSLSLSLSLCASDSLSVSLSVSFSVSFSLSLYLSLFLWFFISVSISLYLFLSGTHSCFFLSLSPTLAFSPPLPLNKLSSFFLLSPLQSPSLSPSLFPTHPLSNLSSFPFSVTSFPLPLPLFLSSFFLTVGLLSRYICPIREVGILFRM